MDQSTQVSPPEGVSGTPHGTLVNPGGTRPPLVYLMNWPHGEHPMLNLAGRLGDDQPVWCLDAPPDAAYGRVPDVDGWVAWYRRQLDVAGLKPPFRLAGWSFGGVVALELARRLGDEGLEVEWLGMLDTWLPKPVPLRFAPFIAQEVVVAYEHLPLRRQRLAHLVFHGRQFWVQRALRVKRRLLRLRQRLHGPMAAAANHEAARFGIRVAWLKYRAKPYRGHVELFTTPASIERWRGDMSLGWSGALQGGYSVFRVPGEHGTMFHDPNAPVLVEALRASMEAVDRRADRVAAGPSGDQRKVSTRSLPA